MLNHTGALAVLDHHIGLNWDDGATLMRVGAQVRYRYGAFATVQTLRVTASARCSDEPLGFEARNGDVHATWVWTELAPGFVAQLSIVNEGDDEVLLEGVDVLRIDAAFGGLFNVGAPPGLWRAAQPGRGVLKWEQWTPDPAASFQRMGELLMQPSASNRLAPPALLFRGLSNHAEELALPLRFELSAANGKFERFAATCVMDERPLAPGVTLVSPEVWVVAGDDARELRKI